MLVVMLFSFANPRFKLKQIQIKKNKILDFIIKFEFPDFSLLGQKFGVFWPQIRIPCEKLYIWSNFGQNTVKIQSN